MKKTNYCSYVYKNIYIEKYQGHRAKVAACCINQHSTPTHHVNFYTNTYLTSQRVRLEQNERLPECTNCWQQEDKGLPSQRQLTDQFITSQDPYLVELLSIDYNVDPLCNAKCIMCGPNYSSMWVAEHQKHSEWVPRTFAMSRNNLVDMDLDLSKIQRIYFNGGEPFLGTDMVDMLEKISQQQQGLSKVSVSVNTNGSIWPSVELFDLLKTVRSLYINVSVDATDQAFEYIRFPLKWEDVSGNIERFSRENFLNSKGDYRVTVSCTVGIHNALELTPLKNWVAQARTYSPWLDNLCLQPVHGQFWFDNASAPVRNYILYNLSDDSYDQTIKTWITQTRPGNDETWSNWLNMIDQRRQLDWRENLPGLNNATQKINQQTC